MLTYLEIAQRLRPRWIVWENVPGVLSSGRGRDFGSFLGALVELGYGVAYRVLDAQWVRVDGWPKAVPQRRRRVFVVGCLGDWERAAQVLFERESVCRDPAKGGATGEGSAADVAGCAATVSSKWAKGTGGPAGDECYNLTTQPVGYRWQNDRDGLVEDGTAPACRASAGTSGFHEMNHPVVVQQPGAVAFQACGDRDNPSISVSDTAFCLPANAMSDRGQAVAFDWQSGGDSRGLDPKDTAQLQRCQTPAVAFNETSATLKGGSGARGYPDPSDGNGHGIVGSSMTVRRLTPRECERLQGFPDDWTLIPWRKKPAAECPDGPRYKALGNSMAVNCMAWIGQRIDASEGNPE